MKVLGVDPGTWRAGVGVVESTGSSYRLLFSGVITLKEGTPIAERLKTIYEELTKIIGKFNPDVLALENIFYNKNVRSMLKIGEARACVMLAAALKNIPVEEYPPASVKQSVVGNGRAAKGQVQAMVKTLLGLSELPPPDAADALAAAICHFHHYKYKLLKKSVSQIKTRALAAAS